MIKHRLLLAAVLLGALVTPVAADIVSNLQLHWRLDEGSGTTVTDLSGNGRTGTFGTTTNAPSWLTTTANCKLAACVSLDGGDGITFTGYNPGTTFTWAWWMYLGTNPAAGTFLLAQTGVDGLYYEGGGANAGKMLGDGINLSTATLPAATWVHIAYVATGTAYQWYFNGVPAGNATGNAMNIAWNIVGWTGAGGINGRLQDVRLYNRALTNADVNELITTIGGSAPDITTGLVLDLPLEEGTGGAGATVVNRVLGSSNGTLGASTAAPTWVVGKVGRWALSFDATDDLLTVPRYSAVDSLTTWTFACWFKATSAGEGNSGVIIMKGGVGGTGTSRWNIILDANGGRTATVRARVYVNSGGTNMTTFTANGAWTAGAWTHLIVTTDGSLTAANTHIYLNNVETTYQSPTNGSGTVTADATFDVHVGGQTNGANTFDGVISRLRLYNRVLSAEDRAALYTHHGTKKVAFPLD